MTEENAPQAQPEATPAASSEVPQDARTMGMVCHLIALAGLVIPFGNVFGPLVIWLMKKDDHPFIDENGKESINFQITVSIAVAISAALIMVCVGLILLPIIGIASIVLLVIAGLKANEGETYRYPLTIRLLK